MPMRFEAWEVEIVQWLAGRVPHKEIADCINRSRQDRGLDLRTSYSVCKFTTRFLKNPPRKRKEGEWLVKDLAEVLGVSPRSIWILIRRCQIPFEVRGNKRFLTWEAITEALDANPRAVASWKPESIRAMLPYLAEPAIFLRIRRFHRRPRVIYRDGRVWHSIKEASEQLGVTQRTIVAWSQLPSPPLKIGL